jgi:murein DD-endopeptidase MepM/ murein hydrolase activator NlpD
MRSSWLTGIVIAGSVVMAATSAQVLASPALASPALAPAALTGTVVTPNLALNVRSGPAVWNRRLRTIANGSPIALACQVTGQPTTSGSVRITRMWDRLPDGTYVSDAWIERAAALPACGSPSTPSTAAAATTKATVASGSIPLKARTGPAQKNQQVAALPNGTALDLVCQQHGQRVVGTTRLTDMWDRLANGTFVSDAYVRRGGTPPTCESTASAAIASTIAGGATATAAGAGAGAPMPAAAEVWVHPLPGFPASNSFRTARQPNHIGVDIMSVVGTPIRAASAGRVVEVVCNIQAGLSCDQPGSAAIRGCGWYVKLQHANRISTIYCHLVRQAPVQVGQDVIAGQIIGYVGTSGNSSFPHLHFEVHVDAPPTGPQNAIDPIPFMRTHGILLDK